MRQRTYVEAYQADKQARAANQSPPEWAVMLVAKIKVAQIKRDRGR